MTELRSLVIYISKIVNFRAQLKFTVTNFCSSTICIFRKIMKYIWIQILNKTMSKHKDFDHFKLTENVIEF